MFLHDQIWCPQEHYFFYSKGEEGISEIGMEQWKGSIKMSWFISNCEWGRDPVGTANRPPVFTKPY